MAGALRQPGPGQGGVLPLFIALASFAAVPLKVLEQCLYLAASALVSALVLRRTGDRWLGTLLFALLALSPVLWNPHLSRVLREGIYGSLALLIVTLTVAVAFPAAPRDARRGVLLGGALGTVGGAFWLTREEGVWLLPALGIVLLIALVKLWVERRAGVPSRRARLLDLGVPLLTAALCFGASNALVAWLNASHYGVFETNEFKSASFQRGYGALSRIRPAEWRRYVVFPADSRQRAYDASPAARELAPAFEGPNGAGWRRAGCEQMWIPAESCPEILSGWFMWALRDAVALAGHYRSAAAAADFYGRLGRRDRRRLRGGTAGLPSAPRHPSPSVPLALPAQFPGPRMAAGRSCCSPCARAPWARCPARGRAPGSPSSPTWPGR